jgi:cyanate lyase
MPARKNVAASLDEIADTCNNPYMASSRKTTRTVTASDLIQQCIAESGLSFIELERRTGVKRQSLMKFVRGEQSLRLDKADLLAEYFGLELTKKRKAKR